ncbi:MAG: TetR/AcrR family transcriptional regulator [Desulfuromusa sp.]|jgi:AcrR family transcriptional regulator|nr:TetR/AcrR family transcriptional regulator [Desulfuromusa sp.]
MARTTDPLIKENLLDKCLDATLEKGIAGFGLRKLAKQVGTSARMLIYHFGSAESLLMDMIREYSNREKKRFTGRMNERGKMSTVGEFIRFNWDTYQKDDRKKVLIVLIEIYARALRKREEHDAFFKDILFEWIELVEDILTETYGFNHDDANRWATLIIAVSRGLLLDWLGSEGTDRTEGAMAVFAGLADNYRIIKSE